MNLAYLFACFIKNDSLNAFTIVFILKVFVWQTVNRMLFTVNRIKS